MEQSKLKLKLEKALTSVNKITGVDGTLVVNNQGEILYSNLSYKDVDLFGSMANIISNSSEKLLDLTKEGQIERVLVESIRGKALFLNLEKAHLVVLTNIKANIGMVILSSKKSAQLIKDMEEIKQIPDFIEEFEEVEVTKSPVAKISDTAAKIESLETIEEPDLLEKPLSLTVSTKSKEREMETAEEDISESVSAILEESNAEESDAIQTDEIPLAKESPSPVEISLNDKINEEIPSKEPISAFAKTETEVQTAKETVPEISLESVQTESKPPKMEIPVIKPPLSFPPLPESVSVPQDPGEKSELITDIYEAILLAMSIGASKIMGTAPARGMLQNSIPYKDCPELLEGVKVESNSALQFNVIRENIAKFPLENRSEKAIDDFTTIISAITDKYGLVMGYDAFRGMIRPEFKKIYESFGEAMEDLGIKEKIHPELRKLLVL